MELEALARQRAAVELSEAGRRVEAEEHARRVLPFWRSVGATRYIRLAEELLGEASEVPA